MAYAAPVTRVSIDKSGVRGAVSARECAAIDDGANE